MPDSAQPDRVLPDGPPAPISNERRAADPWPTLGRRRWQFFVVWIGGFFAMWGVLRVVKPLAPDIVWLPAPFFAIWALAFLIAFWRWHSFPCPWCRRPFFWRFRRTNVFSRRCLHCGAEKGTVPPTRI